MFKTLPKAPASLVDQLVMKKVSPANRNRAPGAFLPEGSRNNDLASIAGYFRSKHGLSESQLQIALSTINQMGAAPLREDEVDAIAHSISNYPARTQVEYDDGPLAKFLAPVVAETSCRTPATGWLRFDGKRWANDPEGAHAKEQIKTRLEQFYQTAVAGGDIEVIKLARTLRTATKIKKVFELVSTDPTIFRDFQDFDQQGAEINLRNGTLCLSDLSLRPHSPGDNITKLADVDYDPEATCPNFDKFLSATLPEELGEFALRLFGYALLGNPKEQIFTIFHGPGSNGKSTLVDVFANVFGNYSTNVEPSSFIKQRNPGVRDDLARLKGARMVATSELSTGEILDSALVKRITGGEAITVRALYKEYFEFIPQFVMFMTTNALPVIDGGDKALARRLIMVPFRNVVSGSQRDPDLPAKLKAETSGIFNRLLEGLSAYQAHGLCIPEVILAEVGKYVESSDLIQTFLDDKCSLEPDAVIPASSLYLNYQRWSGDYGTKPMTRPIFKQEITKRTGIQQKRTSKGQEWPGIGLLLRQL